MQKYQMLLEEDQEENNDFVEIIIGKDGDYEIDEQGNITIIKKETGGPEQNPPPGGSGKPGEPGEEEGNQKSDSEDGEGEEEGEKIEEIGEGSGVNAIDEQHKKTEERLKAGKDLSRKEANEKAKEDEIARREKEAAQKGGRGKGSDANPSEVDYSKIQPKFNWNQIIKMFIASAGEEVEETYQKPSRRSISGIHTARQTGAGAMKPGENVLDAKEVKLAFVIDSSGSMSSIIATMYANIANLLKSNARLSNALFTIIKFSDNWHAWKGMFKSDKAVAVSNVLEKPTRFDGKMSVIFKQHYGSVTNFSADLRENIQKLIKDKYNILIFSDSDVSSGDNMKELVELIKTPGGKVFIIFDTRSSYLEFRKNSGFSTQNITYIGKD